MDPLHAKRSTQSSCGGSRSPSRTCFHKSSYSILQTGTAVNLFRPRDPICHNCVVEAGLDAGPKSVKGGGRRKEKPTSDRRPDPGEERAVMDSYIQRLEPSCVRPGEPHSGLHGRSEGGSEISCGPSGVRPSLRHLESRGDRRRIRKAADQYVCERDRDPRLGASIFSPREPKDLGGLYGPPVERRRGSSAEDEA